MNKKLCLIGFFLALASVDLFQADPAPALDPDLLGIKNSMAAFKAKGKDVVVAAIAAMGKTDLGAFQMDLEKFKMAVEMAAKVAK